MAQFQFKASPVQGEVYKVELECEGVLCPSDLPEILKGSPDIPWGTGVVISGRMPLWVAAALCHRYHPSRWVAVFDPRLAGGVVVQNHHPQGPCVGDVVKI